ncbi:MAG: FKBP-type peptidyl-prolyl cis-trans isomerase [Bacteroidetes bacterium]|nr:FKBP-type peptidyl-prolyl cis-trans isomerase [Bacteroidota bacterium]MCL1968650.1 FKBP-type peptidyl-prolyl cis-trans isomerase [Bacteroidota bacterium]
MKKSVLIFMSLFLVGMTFTLKSQNMTQEEKNSYAIGADIAGNIKNAGIEIIFDAFKEGFFDVMKGANKFTMEEMQACFENIQEKAASKQNQETEIEKEKGKKFLAENKKRKGVQETASGLQYEVIVMGNGFKPEATDQVKVHYTGKTLEGQVFDSSVERGEPIVFGLNQVIKGWTEGLQLMPVGSKFMLYIPSDLAYGDRGAGGLIKPGATLIFEVELLDIPK